MKISQAIMVRISHGRNPASLCYLKQVNPTELSQSRRNAWTTYAVLSEIIVSADHAAIVRASVAH
jgi:hypothetical protein